MEHAQHNNALPSVNIEHAQHNNALPSVNMEHAQHNNALSSVNMEHAQHNNALPSVNMEVLAVADFFFDSHSSMNHSGTKIEITAHITASIFCRVKEYPHTKTSDIPVRNMIN